MKGSTARRVAPVVLAAALALVFTASAATAAPAVNGTFPLKSELNANNKLVTGPEGNIWVTLGSTTKDVAKIPPVGPIEEFDLSGVTEVSGITLGREDRLWVTDSTGVASFKPENPSGTVEATPIAGMGSFHSIVSGPDGKIWVAKSGEVLRFSPLTPTVQEKKGIPELNPRDIDVSGSLVVVADAGKPRIVTLTAAADFGKIEYPIDGGSQGVAGSPSGQIGFSQQIPNLGKPEQVGLITPPGPALAVEQPGDPFGVAFGSDGAFWIVRSGQTGGLARLTSSGQMTLLGGFPAGGTARQIAAGPGNTLWVSVEKNMEPGVIVRVSGLEPPVTPIVAPPPPETKIAKGPKKVVKTTGKRAKVKFRFTSTTAGATFQCALTRVKKVKKGKKAAKPQFKGCKSPKSYNLKPGRYRFSVRAVSAGVVDPSAATRSFRVVHVHKR